MPWYGQLHVWCFCTGGGVGAPPAVQAAQLAAWTAPLKQPAGAGAVAASPPVSVPPSRRRNGPQHAPRVPQPEAEPNAQPARRPAVEQPQQQHDASGDGWVHVSLPVAEGPDAAADAAAPQNGGLLVPAPSVLSQVRLCIATLLSIPTAGLASKVSEERRVPKQRFLTQATPVLAAAAAAAAASLPLHTADTASGELLFDFDGGSKAASPAKADVASLAAAAAVNEVRSQPCGMWSRTNASRLEQLRCSTGSRAVLHTLSYTGMP